MNVFYCFYIPNKWDNRAFFFLGLVICWFIYFVATVNNEQIKPEDKVLTVTISKIKIIPDPIKRDG